MSVSLIIELTETFEPSVDALVKEVLKRHWCKTVWVSTGVSVTDDSHLRARREDPSTSHRAAEAQTPLRMSKNRQRVLDILIGHGPTTDHHILSVYRQMTGRKVPASGPRTRRAELVKMGFVEKADRLGRSPSGQPATRWKVAGTEQAVT